MTASKGNSGPGTLSLRSLRRILIALKDAACRAAACEVGWRWVRPRSGRVGRFAPVGFAAVMLVTLG